MKSAHHQHYPPKIFNDPVHGFIEVPRGIILDVINHPYFQRLRRIRQTGLAALVYPGSVHTRFSHVLGAMHLTAQALETLRTKGVNITDSEATATKLAILLHDIGHGPFSHTTEYVFFPNTKHDKISLEIMHRLNQTFNGQLTEAIAIFEGKHPKRYLHQLISGQLDMDRMDYLLRDSFFTGVQEGVIGADRIIKTMTVFNGELVVEEKGAYAVEKFIIARRLMYWQVYLHKTAIVAEKMMLKILERAKLLHKLGTKLFKDDRIAYFFDHEPTLTDKIALENYLTLDDHDLMYVIKQWEQAPDFVLSELAKRLNNRHLLKIRLSNAPFTESQLREYQQQYGNSGYLTDEEKNYFIFMGKVTNQPYLSESDEQIKIFYKEGFIKDLVEASDNGQFLAYAAPVVKYFICYPG